MITVKIKLLPGGRMPEKKTAGAAAWDCFAREDVVVGDEPVLIGLGFALEIPEGYHAKIVPRSSIGLKSTLRQPNCVGIIDADYRGEVKAMYESKISNIKTYYNNGEMLKTEILPTRRYIKAGERIAQMLIERNEDAELIPVNELSETARGDGGFGSTGA